MSTDQHENLVELKSETPVTATPSKRATRKAPARKAAAKSTTRRIKEPAKKAAKRVAGEKAQTQVDKHLSKWFNAQAKEQTSREEKVRRADVIRKALLRGAKAMGYKPVEA